MIKRILVLSCLIGLYGCILPNIPPSPKTTSVIITSLPPTNEVGTPDSTNNGEFTATITVNPEESVTPLPDISTPEQPVEATRIPEPLPTPFISYQYQRQPGSPNPIMNFAHPEAGCDWMGVGGQVFDLSGNPNAGLVVKLTGELDGESLDMIALTGGALYLGPGGYEFKISDHPIATSDSLWLTIYDNQGNALSDPVPFSTYASCDQNFILVNFVQMMKVINGYKVYLPVIVSNNNP